MVINVQSSNGTDSANARPMPDEAPVMHTNADIWCIVHDVR
jgi:hypothetical protein